MRSKLMIAAFAVFLGGCTTPPVSYYYGKYSKTLYHSRKDGTPESQLKHRQSLEEIIDHSGRKHLKVPPGIYCEYAYLLAVEGDPNAGQFFDMEVQTYPESERFVAFLKQQLGL